MKNLLLHLAMVLILITLCLPFQLAVMAANAKPVVIPELREWTGGTGYFTITGGSRICVDPAYATGLADSAAALQEDLLALNGLNLSIINTASPAGGDFYLTLNCSDSGIGTEGYLFESGNWLTIRANNAKGALYGTRTALQILKQDAGMNEIPQGTARDYPKYRNRGFMLDVGRMYFSMSTLRDYIKYMAWYKMNDFHLHLNDNKIGVTYTDWQTSFAAFRLESTTYPGLTATDGSYTKTEFTALQNLAKKYAATITPEIDTPAHSLAFIKFKPELQHPSYGADMLDLGNSQTQPFMNTIWDEYVPIFQADAVHIGADEYNTSGTAAFKTYVNANHAYLKGKGKKCRMWGVIGKFGGASGFDRDLAVQIWRTDIYNPKTAVADGYEVINSTGTYLYIVPCGTGYNDYLNCQSLFDTWEPYVFGGASYDLTPAEPKLLGGAFCVWNDKLGQGYDVYGVYDRVKPAMQTLGQKMWSGATGTTYATFSTWCGAIGNAPGTSLQGAAPTPVPGNLAAGRPVVASSVESGTSFTADKAVDSQTTTRWSSARTDPQWINVDLGQAYNVNRVKILWEAAYAKSYQIQVSNDATNWTDAYVTTTGDGGTDDFSFPAKSGRYVRMYGTQRGSTYGYSLWEFEIYGSTGTPGPTATPTPTPTATPTPTPGGTVTVNPVADSYGRDGSYANTNYGTDTTMVVKKDGSGYNRKSYARFNFGAFGGSSATLAKFRVYVANVNTDATRTVKIYGTSDETWSETGITWNNAPAGTTLINSITVTNTGGVWYEIDVTSYVNSQFSDKVVSFLLINEGTASAKDDVSFASKEAATGKPELVIQ
jgi:hypothetical protein